MPRNRNDPIIETVVFDYVGTDRQFNEFLKTVFRDYLAKDPVTPEDKEDVSDTRTE